LEVVLNEPLLLSVAVSLVVPTFSNTISNIGPHYSTIVNTSARKTTIPDDVFESYRLAQTMIAPYLNKITLENPAPQQPNNPNCVEFNKCKEDLVNVVKTKLGVDIGNTNLYKKLYDAHFDNF
jgi:hypothetical protein